MIDLSADKLVIRGLSFEKAKDKDENGQPYWIAFIGMGIIIEVAPQCDTWWRATVIYDDCATSYHRLNATGPLDIAISKVMYESREITRRLYESFGDPIPTDNSLGGVSEFFGTWPGDETDNELLEALSKIE